MNTINPWVPNPIKTKKRLIILKVLFYVILYLFFSIVSARETFRLIIYYSFQEKPYQIHHPALYSVQDNFFQLGGIMFII